MDLKNNDDEEGDFSNSDGEASVRAGESHFPYILLNEIKAMISQLAMRCMMLFFQLLNYFLCWFASCL